MLSPHQILSRYGRASPGRNRDDASSAAEERIQRCWRQEMSPMGPRNKLSTRRRCGCLGVRILVSRGAITNRLPRTNTCRERADFGRFREPERLERASMREEPPVEKVLVSAIPVTTAALA